MAMDYDKTEVAASYDRARALAPEAVRLWQDLLSVHIDSAAISLVIDLGSGTGRFSELLAAHFGVQVIGIDPSHKMVDQARRKASDRKRGLPAGFGGGASAPGWLRRSRVHVDGRPSPNRSERCRKRMPSGLARRRLRLHPLRHP